MQQSSSSFVEENAPLFGIKGSKQENSKSSLLVSSWKQGNKKLFFRILFVGIFPLFGLLFPSLSPVSNQSTPTKPYNWKDLRGDVIAGLTVGVMLIPQGMAYSLLANLPPIYGLYSSLLCPLVYGLMGSSRHLSVGPVAVVSMLTADSMRLSDEDGSWSVEDRISFAMGLALVVGVITFSLGFLRMGFIESILSHPLTSGYLSAVAVVIGASQLGNLLGISGLSHSKSTFNTIYDVFANVNKATVGSVIMSLICLVLLFGSKFVKTRKNMPVWVKLFPDLLIVIVTSILVTWLARLDEKYQIVVLRTIPSGLPLPSFPVDAFVALQKVLPSAASIALVGYVESASVAKALASKHRYRLDSNQDLIGLGMANIISSLFQGFPVSGSPPRTAVNEVAGAASGLAAAFSGIFIAFSLLLLAPYSVFYFLPIPVMAAVIIVAVWDLFDFKEFLFLLRVRHWIDLAQFLVVFFLTIFLGVSEGVFICAAISVVMILKKSTTLELKVIGAGKVQNYREGKGKQKAENYSKESETKLPLNIRLVELHSQLYFANVIHFQSLLDEVKVSLTSQQIPIEHKPYQESSYAISKVNDDNNNNNNNNNNKNANNTNNINNQSENSNNNSSSNIPNVNSTDKLIEEEFFDQHTPLPHFTHFPQRRHNTTFPKRKTNQHKHNHTK
eukprot:TRINITY_DN4942_c0_g1_i2.p1 TRINITY_DN4942_c0_g1~~TRINITY_DN4942_c0_g1_i2.p1  ORF type:complete len:671 (+),score=144.31 TRINITY_DN4942_c0_g1_i2:336-2348(+)